MSNNSGSVNGFLNPNAFSNCTVDTCPIITSYYNYRIDLAPNAVFLSIFSLSWFAYLGTWIFARRGLTGLFFMLAMEFGVGAEIIGYAGRVLSFQNQWGQNGFLMQIVCLTLAPAFFSAAIYLCLGRIVEVYGKENSRLPPAWYTRLFIPCDMVSMILQGAGAGIASVALQDNQSLTTGDNVMIAGLASQVFTMFVFMCLSVDFALRVRRRSRTGEEERRQTLKGTLLFKGFLVALAIATVCVFWRSVFRVVELNSGWAGPLTFKQNLFIGFEGVLMVITVVVLAVFHPALCMGEAMDGGWKILGL